MFYTDGNTAYLSIDGEITEELSLEFKNDFFAIESMFDIDTIEISINSVGGAVIYGWTIFNLIAKSKKNTITVNAGACYSFAAIILLAGKVRKAWDYSLTLIHNPFYPDNEDLVDAYLLMIKDAVTLVISHSFDSSKLEEWMLNDATFKAEELLEMAVIDEVISSDIKVNITKENTPYEIYNIMNVVRKNKNSEMSKEVKNELVEETKIEKVETEVTEVVENTTEVKVETEESEYKKVVEELKIEFAKLKEEKLALEEKIKTLTEEKIVFEKDQILNSAKVTDKESWMKLDTEVIKNLLNSVPKPKSPNLAGKTNVMNASIKPTMNDYTAEELKHFAKTDEEFYMTLYRNTAEINKKK